MNAIFVMFLPSVLAVKTYIYLVKEKDKNEIIIMYLIYVLLSNLSGLTGLLILKKITGNFIFLLESNIIFSIKYMFLLIFFNIFYAILFSIIKKYVEIRIEVTYGEKK